MQMNRLLMGIYNLCRWITYFFYLNMLWVVFTLLGGIVFGVMPSTIALYSIARKTAMGEEDIPLLKTYWQTFRKEFLRGNGLGYVLLTASLIIYFNLHFFRSFDGIYYSLMNFVMIIVAIVFIMVVLYIFPVYVHYELKLLQYVKQAVMISFLQPINIVAMLVTSVATYYFLLFLPGFIPLFALSLLSHLNMWMAFQSFLSIEKIRVKRRIGELHS